MHVLHRLCISRTSVQHHSQHVLFALSLLTLFLVLLLPRLGSSPLAVALGINLRRKRVLKAQRNRVNDVHQPRKQNTSRLAKQQRGAQEAHRRARVHGGSGNIKRESSDHFIHEEAKIVAQKGAPDAKAPCRGKDENVAAGDEGVGSCLRVCAQQERVRRLLGNGRLVEPVADDAEGEDGCGERVVGDRGVAAKQLCQDLVVVFWDACVLALVGGS